VVNISANDILIYSMGIFIFTYTFAQTFAELELWS